MMNERATSPLLLKLEAALGTDELERMKRDEVKKQ